MLATYIEKSLKKLQRFLIKSIDNFIKILYSSQDRGRDNLP